MAKDKTKICKYCKTEIPSKAKFCPNCQKKQKNNLWWKILVGLLSLSIFGSLLGGGDNGGNTSSSVNESSKKESEPKVEVVVVDFSSMTSDDIYDWGKDNKIEISIEKEYSNDVADGEFISQSVGTNEKAYQGDKIKVIYSLGVEPSKEYKNALKKAESYSKTMHMSKQGIFEQLTSEYGENFPVDAAEWAMEHIEADWNANALAKAESYSNTMHMSKQGIYEQLISEFGEQFTTDEAQYAIDNIEADWNANALAKAKVYQDSLSMSKNAIYDQLVSSYGEGFTAEEAQYAVDHLDE